MPLVVTKVTVRKKMSLAFSFGNITYNGIVPININTIHIKKIDKIQLLLSIVNLLILLLEIYKDTKINIESINNKTKGIILAFNRNDQNMANTETKEIIICKIKRNGYDC